MTRDEIRQYAREGIEKLNPIIRNADNMVAEAYQLGFDVGLKLGKKSAGKYVCNTASTRRVFISIRC